MGITILGDCGDGRFNPRPGRQIVYGEGRHSYPADLDRDGAVTSTELSTIDSLASSNTQIDDHFLTRTGKSATVTGLTVRMERVRVYNLQVAEHHLYAVTDAGVLVHNSGLNGQPFKGKSPSQIGKILKRRGYKPKGPNPNAGKGRYVDPKTGKSFHLDPKHGHPPGPHVDCHPAKKFLPKHKKPMF